MRVLELFSGVGGWRYALPPSATVVAAYDVSPAANATYALNHGDLPRPRELATIPTRELADLGADTWVLSPPCQPYCRMGLKADLADARTRALLRILEILEEAPPQRLVLENVEGFLESQSHARLAEVLDRLGFHRRALRLCPTALGVPNQRPRVYVLASREPLPDPLLLDEALRPLADYLDATEDPALYLPEPVRAKHWMGLDLVRPGDRRSSCFIGGYGQRFVGSGSFLVTEQGVRRFSPREVGRLLGLPETFRFPEGLSLEKRYKLLGNGLSIPAARWVLGHLV
ncbi:MAG TPA: DNA cytosine methyltransferase [Holophagaceae bacterium]|nr:DNA cytosine methyltransferase [Holophagaceae bacterium]